MINLLSILVSLAMMLTGATAPMAEPASRTLLLGNLTVRCNDEEVVLNPYAAMGVATDGEKAVYDFYVGSGEDTYLPFQLTADQDGLLFLSDNSNVTLKLDKADLDELFGDAGLDGESQAILSQLFDFGTAYGNLFKMIGDTDAMKEIQVKGNAIYDEMVDRGGGVPGKVELDGETLDVITYEYTLDGRQLGELTDACMKVDARLTDYAEAYFKLLSILPEDSGLRDIDSFAALFEKTGIDMTMTITESVAEGGVTITDAIIHISEASMPEPLEMVTHGVKSDDEQTATMASEIDVEDMLVSLYSEASLSGRDMAVNMTMTANPKGEGQEADAEAAIDEAFEAEDEDAEEVEDVEIGEEAVDGEDDSEDAYYFTVDYDQGYDEGAGKTNRSLNYTLDIAEMDAHAEFAIDGASSDDGSCAYLIGGGLDIGEQSFGFSLEANVLESPIEQRASAEGAIGVSELDPSVLIAGVSADALKLYTEESVQKAVALVRKAIEANTGVEEPIPLDGDGMTIQPAIEENPDDVEAPPAEMTFANPRFNWLPEGYAVDEINVNAEYQDVSCSIVNEATGENIFIDISNSFNDSTVNHYMINDDGSYAQIEGAILNQEINEDYSFYSMDDGALNISVFPSGQDITYEDVIHILSALTF